MLQNNATTAQLTFGLVRINGSIRAFGESEVPPRVSANLAALLFSFRPSAAVTVN